MNTKAIREAIERLQRAEKYADECRRTLDKSLYRPAERAEIDRCYEFRALLDPATVIALCDAADELERLQSRIKLLAHESFQRQLLYPNTPEADDE